MAFFIHRSDGTQAQLVQVAGTRLRIGRGTNAELRFDDAAVDLEHAVIEQQATGGYAVSDRGSVTGTYLNGERLSAPARLRQDDEVDVGPFRLRVQHADPEDPLFLHVARIEQAEEADATFISQLLAERSGTLPVDEGSIYGTIRVASDDLLAMAEAKRRQLEGSAAPPSPSPSPVVAAASAGVAGGASLEAPAIDYVRAFRLERGVFKKGLLTVLLAAATGGAIYGLAVSGKRQEIFNPGPLVEAHRQRIGGDCASCHGSFEAVTPSGCTAAGCHGAKRADHHQERLARTPGCTACHLEHRGLAALRLVGAGGCTDCHGALPLGAGMSPRYADGIRGFTAGHPEFAIELGDGDRLRLDAPGARRSDPGELEFNHRKHLTSERIRGARGRLLACGDCHRQDGGEIAPVRYEVACRECHPLVVDGRLPLAERQAPHAPPAEVLDKLIAVYVRNPQVLARASAGERSLLRRNLTRQQQLGQLARFNAAALLRDRCTECHHLTPPAPSPAEVGTTRVRPTRVRPRWLDHARFRHRPHLDLELACTECHGEVEASSSSDDVLLPSIAACQACHRGASDAERRADRRLASDACRECHLYHAAAELDGGSPEE